MRAAIDWCLRHDARLGIALTGAVANLFFLLGHMHELHEHAVALEPHVEPGLPTPVLARYWIARCRSLWGVDHRRMLDYAQRAEHLYRSLNNERQLGGALYCAVISGRLPTHQIEPVLQELRRMDRPKCPVRLLALIKGAEFQVLHAEGRYQELQDAVNILLNRQGAAGLSDLSESHFSWIANWLVASELELGNLEGAGQLARQIVGDQRALQGRQSMANFAFCNLARALMLQGHMEEARVPLSSLFDRCRAAGCHGFTVFSDLCTLLALCERRVRSAAMLAGYSDSAWKRIGQQRTVAGNEFRTRTDASLNGTLGQLVASQLAATGAQLGKV